MGSNDIVHPYDYSCGIITMMGQAIIMTTVFILASLTWMTLGYFFYEVLEDPYEGQE
jgi:hypothetical protein